MDTAHAVPGAAGTPAAAQTVWTVSEPTFGVARRVALQVTKEGLLFEDDVPLAVGKQQVERLELLEWWEDYRRIVLTFRDEAGESHTRTFVASRLLGPDAAETARLFRALSKELVGKVVDASNMDEPVVTARKSFNPRRAAALAAALILPAIVAILVGPLPAIGAALSAIVLLCVSREGVVWRQTVIRTVSIAFALGCILAPVIAFGSRISIANMVKAAPGGGSVGGLPWMPGASASSVEDTAERLAAIAQKKRGNQTGFPSAEEAMPAIQQAASDLQVALWQGDKTAYFRHIDQTNGSWKEVQTDWFNGYKGNGGATDVKFTTEALSVDPLAKGYYRAKMRITIENSKFEDGTTLGYWIFRVVDGNWYLSEPDERELGNRLAKDYDKFSLVYWEWDKDYLDDYAAMTQSAYARVAQKLGREPEKKPRIIVRPIFRNYRADFGLGELGFFHTQIPDEVYVRSPYSFGGSGWKEGEAFDGPTVTVVAHELTHLFHQQRFVSIKAVPLWMSEGLAEHVAGDYRTEVLQWARRENKLLPVAKLDSLDLDEKEPGIGSIVYGESAMLVRYIDERWGMDTFWELAKRYTANKRTAKHVEDVLGVSLDQLNADFQGWLNHELGG